MARRSSRRWYRRLLRWFGGTVLGLLLIVVLAYLLLQTVPGREIVRGIVEEQVNANIAGTLQIGEIAEVSLGGARVRNAALLDQSGRTVLEIGEADVDIDLAGLIGGDIAIDEVVVRDPSVVLIPGINGQPTLLSAIQAPKTDEPEPPPPPEDPTAEPTTIRVSRIELTGGVVDSEYPEARNAALEDIALLASVRMRESVDVLIDSLTFDVTESGEALLALEPFAGHLSTGRGEVSRLAMTLSGSGTDLDITAWVWGIADGEKPNGSVVISMLPLDTSILRRLGFEDLYAQVPEWVRGRIHLSGNQAVADLKMVVDTPGGPFNLRGHVENLERLEATFVTPGLALGELSAAAPAMRVEGAVGVVAGPAGAGERWVLLSARDVGLDDTVVPDVDLVSRLGEDYIQIEDLALPGMGMEGVVTGRVGFNGDVDVEIDIPPVDLGEVPQLAELGAEGRVAIEASVQLGPSDWPNVHWHGNIQAENVRYGELRADSLSIAGQAHGTLPGPQLNLDISATNLFSGETGIEEAELHAMGGPEDYDLTGHVGIVDGPYAEADLSARWLDEVLQVDGQIAVDYQGEHFEAELLGIHWEPDVQVRAELVEVNYGAARLQAGGQWSLVESEGTLRAEWDDIDLASLGGRLGIPELPAGGIVSGALRFEGSIGSPVLDADLGWRDGSAAGVEGITADVDLAYGRQEMTLDVQVDAPDMGDVSIVGAGAFVDRAPPQEALMAARWDIEMTAALPNLERVAALMPPGSPPLSGAVLVRANLAGTLDAPEGQIDLDGEALRLPQIPSLVDARMNLEYDGRELALDMLVEDIVGQLFGANLTAELTRADLESGAPLDALLEQEWSLSAWVPMRNINDFGVTGLQDAPLLVAVEARMGNTAQDGPAGEVLLTLRAPQGDGEEQAEAENGEVVVRRVGREDDAGCEVPHGAVTEMVLTFDTESTRLELRNERAFAPVLEATLQLPEAWLANIGVESDGGNVLDAQVVIDELEVDRVPVACQFVSGFLDGDIQLTGAMGDEPSIVAEIRGENLSWGDAIPFDLTMNASNMAEHMVVQIGLVPAAAAESAGEESEDGGQADIGVSVPIRWGSEDIAPRLEGGTIQARLDFERFAVAPLSPLVPMLRGDGRINGTLVVMGASLEELLPEGDLTLEDLAITLPGVDQRLNRMSGTIRIEGETVHLEDLYARDRDGEIRLGGSVVMAGIEPQSVDIRIETEEFPMRQAGIIAAWMSTQADISAEIGPEEIVARVELSDLAIRLPEQMPRRVLSLERNPDVIYDDEVVFHIAQDLATGYHSWLGPWSVTPPADDEVIAEAAEDAARDEGPPGEEMPLPPEHDSAQPREGRDVPPVTEADQRVEQDEPSREDSEEVVEGQPGQPAEEAAEDRLTTVPGEPPTRTVRLALDATEPFWVRRTDFSIQLTADLDVVATGEGARISGPVEVRRGFIDLFGRTFQFEAGELVFTGGRELDALLDLTAVHELDRYPGDTVTVSISGRLAEPEMELTSTLEDVQSEAEIAQLLLTGRVSGSSGEPVGAENQVASFLGGLTAGLLTMTARRELGDAVPLISVQAGDSLDDVQVRAGFVADRIVPDFLEGVVQGAYVEGFVGRESVEGDTTRPTETSGAGASRTTGGFLIELYFPYGLVSITSFEPPASWSQDVRWQP